jgi:hypothetical protein
VAPVRIADHRCGTGYSGAINVASVTIYAEDCLLAGELELGQSRLSDLLNDRTGQLLLNVSATSLADRSIVELDELTIAADEILAVETGEGRGDPARRRRTRQFPLVVRIGPYVVRGYFHALPGADPVDSFRRRPAFVPLTDVRLEFTLGVDLARSHAATLLVNRELADSVEEGVDDAVDVPELPDQATDAKAKDFTYEVLVSDARD